MKRRDLLRMLGSALGGVILTSCDDASPTGPSSILPALPNGFRFYPLKYSGSALPGGGTADRLVLDATIDDRGEVLYSAVMSELAGLYGMSVDLAAGTPSVLSERAVVRCGDLMSDGSTVVAVRRYDVNAHGGLAVVARVVPVDGGELTTEIVYLDRGSGALQPVLYDGFLTSDGHELLGVFGDIDIHTGHDLAVVASYIHWDPEAGIHREALDPNDRQPRDGIFAMDVGNPASLRLVTHGDEHISGVDDLEVTFGLIDMHDDGNYIAQATAARPIHTGQDSSLALSSVGGSEHRGALLVQGNVHLGGLRVAAAPASINVVRLFQNVAVGDSYLGPRIGAENMTAYVLHHDDMAMSLYYHGLEVVTTGERSPGGSTVLSIMPPVFGPAGELYYLLHTRDGHELCATNGEQQRTILASGDRLIGEDRRVDSIAIGSTTEHCNSAGQLAFAVILEDDTATVVLGNPE